MDIKVSTEQARVPVTILHVEGDIDSFTYDDFLSKAQELIQDGARYLIIDLAQVPYISSAGLRAIYTIFKDLRAVHPEENLSEEQMENAAMMGTYKSPHLKLLNLSDGVHGVFQMGGFDRYIEIFTDREKALASF
ncbi:MAG TPA: STAS domain-containing protein [Anaerolineales bacterium]|nr:STAS domain-containing protein [Anaerolineales bacterium]